MNLKKITQTHLSFDPLKPVILRGSPDEDAKSVFSGNVVLTLPKPTKVSSVSVTLKSTATTYWPEGIGERGTRLTADKVLGEETLQILHPAEAKEKSTVQLPAGVHRFPFVFLVPNSIVESIEDVYGRVRHVVEARVSRPGIPFLSSLSTSKTVLILRTYMSNSLLTNNSLQDLSRTLEKRTSCADIQIIIEQAAFSSGDAFHIRTLIQPQRKHVRLEHLNLTVTEFYRYLQLELRASRTGQENFPLIFKASCSVNDGETSEDTTEQLQSVFEKNSYRPVEVDDTFAHRLTFATPTCQQNIHHTSTHFKEIQYRHFLTIKLILSYPDDGYSPVVSRSSSMENLQSAETSAAGTGSGHSSDSEAGYAGWHNMFSKFKVTRGKHKDKRIHETILLDVPITVFDCRLKEDFGRLPSYFELGVTPSVVRSHAKKHSKKEGFFTGKSGAPEIDKPNAPPFTFLCPCYYDFAEQMQYASQFPFLVTTTTNHETHDNDLERIPSIPPPDYV